MRPTHRTLRPTAALADRGSMLLRVAAAWLLVLAMLFGAMQGAALARPPVGGEPEPRPGPEPTPPPFERPANGFDWSVPDRFLENADGRLAWRWNADARRYDDPYVNPASWPMHIRGCQTASDLEDSIYGRPTAHVYTFESAHGPTVEGRSCLLTVHFPEEARYDVRWTARRTDGSILGSWAQTVEIKDYLIVAMGDSYGSGEGAPEYDRPSGARWGRWVDERCHRSSFAGAPQAARMIEKADPKTSVTFLSFACSGATISREYADHNETTHQEDMYDPWKPGDPARNNGSGILGPFRGVQPPNDDYRDKLPSQLDQLVNALVPSPRPADKVREVDALVVSAGGNDASFAPLGSACVVWDDCVHPGNTAFTGPSGGKVNLKTRIDHDLATLPARYDALGVALRGLTARGVRIGGTYMTEYPDPGTQRVNGQVRECDYILDDVMLTMEMSGVTFLRPHGSELGFARNYFLPKLNQHLADATARHGWRYVDGINAGFQGHGYCVGARGEPNDNRFIQTAILSTRQQGPMEVMGEQQTKGVLHPNRLGYQVYRNRIVAHVSPELVKRGPDGGRHHRFPTTPTPPTTTAVAAPVAGAGGWHTGPVDVSISATAVDGRTVTAVHHRLGNDELWLSAPGSTATRTLTEDGTWHVGHRAVDNAGDRGTFQVLTVRIDRTAPARPTLDLGGATSGWNRSPITVTATSSDAGSGLDRLEQRLANGTWTAMTDGRVTITADGQHTLEVRAVDKAGNVSQTATTALSIDTTAPQVACATADDRWHPANVAIACTATDVGSGLTVADAAFTLTTDVTEGTETADATTAGRQVCDRAGNCTDVAPVSGNRVDRRAPELTLLSDGPHGGVDTGKPWYRCGDAGSGVASCTAFSRAGEQQSAAQSQPVFYEVVAVDGAGNRTVRIVGTPTDLPPDSGNSRMARSDVAFGPGV